MHLSQPVQRLTFVSWNKRIASNLYLGAVHKVRHARGERGSKKVQQFVKGEGVQEHVTSHFKKIVHMKSKIESDV